MHAVDIIGKKRDGEKLTKQEIEFMIDNYVSGDIPDYQMAAFCMAIYFQGMDPEEITDLTLKMAHSGDTLDLSSIQGRKIDKHSTGGVGDTTTLIVAPLVASCGVPVAKMSGRGLGHTGGTIDKLESIPGYRVDLSPREFVEQVNRIGVSVVGQTGELAPADKLLYALRDVTATVESIPLIASSIMSKKIAAGADGFVLDVKVGRGAFMKTVEDAVALAKTMVSIGTLAEKETVALVTDMNQPLGRGIGNALEVKEAILTLDGQGPANLQELCLELASEMLIVAGYTTQYGQARRLLEKKLREKAGLQKLADLVEAQGGTSDVINDPSLLPTARYRKPVVAEQSGYVTAVDPLEIGMAAMHLGAGRETKDSEIDLAVGIELKRQVGDEVSAGDELAIIHANSETAVPEAVLAVRQAFTVEKDQISPNPLIYTKITSKDV